MPFASRVPPRNALARIPMPVVRMFLLAAVAVVASVYALVRYYTHPRRPPVVVQAPAPAGSEIPVDLEPSP